jgi:cytochrome P450
MGLVWGNRALTLRRWHERYGEMFTVREPVVGQAVVLSNPEHIRTVFAGDVEVFRAGEGNRRLAMLLGKRSVLVLDGAEHREQRRLLMPAFHGEQVRWQEPMMREVIASELDRWPVGTVFPAHERTRELALEIILRTVVGVNEPDRLDVLRLMLPPIVNIGPKLMLMVPFPRLRRIGPWRRYSEHKVKVDALLTEEIGRRLADPDLARRQDVLSTLVRRYAETERAAQDGELRDQLITLLLAGHETSATALAWCLYLLARDPTTQQELHESVDAGRRDYAAAVVTEALRVRPVIVNVARRLGEPAVVGGRLLPAGITVQPSISLVHHDDRNHPQARQFRPKRWLGGTPGEQHGMMFPFGGGPRRCLGAPFAVAELNIAIEEIARRFHVIPAGRPESPKMRHVTQVPARGARIRLIAR